MRNHFESFKVIDPQSGEIVEDEETEDILDEDEMEVDEPKSKHSPALLEKVYRYLQLTIRPGLFLIN